MYVSVSVSLLLTFHFLPPAHVVCEKVMLSVVSVSQSVRLSTEEGGSPCVTTTSDAMDNPPPSPHGPVHLGPSYPLSPVDPLHRAVDLRLKGLLVFCFVLLSHEWDDRTFRKKNIQTFGLKKVPF